MEISEKINIVSLRIEKINSFNDSLNNSISIDSNNVDLLMSALNGENLYAEIPVNKEEIIENNLLKVQALLEEKQRLESIDT